MDISFSNEYSYEINRIIEELSKNISAQDLAEKINEIFKKYSIKQVTKEKSCLLKIKKLRNILAHGEKTFNLVGREILNAELRQMSYLTKTCLIESIDNVCNFLTSKTYLNSKQASRSKP